MLGTKCSNWREGGLTQRPSVNSGFYVASEVMTDLLLALSLPRIHAVLSWLCYVPYRDPAPDRAASI